MEVSAFWLWGRGTTSVGPAFLFGLSMSYSSRAFGPTPALARGARREVLTFSVVSVALRHVGPFQTIAHGTAWKLVVDLPLGGLRKISLGDDSTARACDEAAVAHMHEAGEGRASSHRRWAHARPRRRNVDPPFHSRHVLFAVISGSMADNNQPTG